MNFISCYKCGVVIDLNIRDRLPSRDNDGGLIFSNIGYDNGEYRVCVKCPVCKKKIITDEKA